MTQSRRMLVVAAVAVCVALSVGHADVTLPAVIGDNMVLQRGVEARVWGMAEPGEKVTVRLCEHEVSAVADASGDWQVKLPTMAAGGPFEMTVAGNNTIPVRNVLIGEVWVCSGQSNMAMSVSSSFNAAAEIRAANHPGIRLFSVRRKVSEEPLRDCEGAWAVCSPQTVGGFSAVGYFFGRTLHETLGVPVGLINSSWGGTPAEAWMTVQTLEADEDLRPILARWEQILANYPAALERYNTALAAWKTEAEKAREAGNQPPAQPRPPAGPDSPHRPASLFNGMISPLLPYAIRGAIWYQGESNAGRAWQYRKLFPAMIRDWREAWGQGDFPFLFVQLANYMAVEPQPANSAWAELREAQTMTLALPNTGMACIIEVGEENDIHPRNKQDVGKRLAMAALGTTCGLDIPHSGPMYESMKIEGNRIRISFTHTDGGLKTPLDAPVNGFAIAGEDRKFYWGNAVIEGDCVVVSARNVTAPVAVRYGWGNNPVCNLYNGAGLPAVPFRTDDWPGVTDANR